MSDPIDAVAIARVVAGDEDLPSARRLAPLSDLKLLVGYRDQLVRARTQMADRVHADLVVIRPGYEQAVPNLRARRHVIKARTRISRDRSVRAELVRRRLGEILRLEAKIAEADRGIADKFRETDTTLTQIPHGVGDDARAPENLLRLVWGDRRFGGIAGRHDEFLSIYQQKQHGQNCCLHSPRVETRQDDHDLHPTPQGVVPARRGLRPPAGTR